MSWPIAKLGDHIHVLSGFAFNSKEFSDSEGVPLIRIRDVVRGFTETYYNGEFDHKYLIKKGDLLVGMDGQFNAVRWRSGKALLNQRVCKIESLEKLDERYLSHLLPNKLKEIEDRTAFVTVKHLSVKKIKEIKFPLPPIDEQRRIAAILDKANEIKQTSKDVNSSKYDVLQSYFVEIFGDPSVRDRWPSHSIEEIADDVQYGTAKKANEDGFGIPVLRMNNLTEEGFINLDSLKHCELEDKELSKFTVSKFDILFNRTNSPKLVGKTSLWLFNENYSFAGYLIRVRLNPDIIDPYYLWTYMNSAYCKAFLFQKAKASNNMSNFSGGELKKMVVPVPPKPLQMKFRKLVENTMQGWELIDSIEDLSSTLVDSLRQEILA